MTPPGPPGDPRAPEDVVRGFLLDVRCVTHPVVERSPDQYAAHVQEVQRAVGPWTFEVLGVAAAAGRVGAVWRQTGAAGTGGSPGRRVVEHGRASHLVESGRITQYWIDARQEVLP